VRLDGVRLQRVVGVDEHQVLAAGRLGSGVARGTQTGVGLTDDLDPPIPPDVRLHDVDAPVGGSVVDQDDLKPRIGLSDEAVQASGQVALHTIDRDHQADQRAGTALAAPAAGPDPSGAAPGRGLQPGRETIQRATSKLKGVPTQHDEPAT
jgi:hypothetical protein